MGNASKGKRTPGLRFFDGALVLLGAALLWPLLAVLLLGGDRPWPAAFWLDLAPSLVLIAVAAFLFIKAARA